MTEKRFFKKEYAYDWWFVFDREQKYTEDMKIPFETDYGNLIAMSEDQVIDELNNLNDENQSLKQYKNSVRDILVSYAENSNLTAKQNQIIIKIMKELGVLE